jgi:hypothetical protein
VTKWGVAELEKIAKETDPVTLRLPKNKAPGRYLEFDVGSGWEGGVVNSAMLPETPEDAAAGCKASLVAIRKQLSEPLEQDVVDRLAAKDFYEKALRPISRRAVGGGGRPAGAESGAGKAFSRGLMHPPVLG